MRDNLSQELNPPAPVSQYADDATLAEMQIAIDNSMTGISWLDTDGIFRQVRDGYARMLGYLPEELLGESWSVTVPEADHAEGVEAFGKMLESGRTEVETRALRKDGSIFYKRLLLVKTTDDQGRHNGHYCFMSDVSERKESQRRIADAERLKTIGTLAGGIAHDLNNLLTPILGYADVLTHDATYKEDQVGSIRDAALRAQELIAQLLQLSRPDSGDMTAVSVSSAVRTALQFVTGSLPANVGIETEFFATDDTVLGKQSALELMIMNLAANAGHAMRESGGTLSISLTNPDPGEIALEVSDTGRGMPQEMINRIFDPFFTTKPPAEGTGLGLLMVKEAVESMSGSIKVDSEPGRGSTFTIRLPLYTQEAANNEPQRNEAEVAGRRILLVDDDPCILEVCEAMLASLGHEVSCFTDPEEALAQDLDGYDLVLTDYHISGTSGLDLVRRLESFQGPVILMSGHFENAGTLPDKVVRCLNKPFKLADLSAAIQEALEPRD